MANDTRIFYVTDSREANEELHETLEEAQAYRNTLNTGTRRRIRACMVRNAYQDGDGWNYDDQADTFNTLAILEEE